MTVEQRKNKRALAAARKQLHADLHRRALQAVELQLRTVKRRRREALAAARVLCKRLKMKARNAVKLMRARERERINAEAQALRAQACTACEHRRNVIRASAARAEKKAEDHGRELRRLDREARRIDSRKTRELRRLTTTKERRQESDDEVARNVGAELLQVWEKHKRRFGQPRNKSRTEAFLEWVEENPGEVLETQAERGAALAARDIAEMEKLARELRRPRKRAGYSVDELQALRRLGIDPLAPPSLPRGPAPF